VDFIVLFSYKHAMHLYANDFPFSPSLHLFSQSLGSAFSLNLLFCPSESSIFLLWFFLNKIIHSMKWRWHWMLPFPQHAHQSQLQTPPVCGLQHLPSPTQPIGILTIGPWSDQEHPLLLFNWFSQLKVPLKALPMWLHSPQYAPLLVLQTGYSLVAFIST
jgi:hypothetical protein